MKLNLIACFICLTICSIVQAEIINIPVDFETIQAGINAAEDNDTVLVAPGIYTEALLIQRKAITIASNFIIDGDEAAIVETVLDGEDQHGLVRFEECNGLRVAICGFSIIRGREAIGLYTSSPILTHLIIRNSSTATFVHDSNPIIENVLFEENGFGVWLRYRGRIVMRNAIIRNNEGQSAICITAGSCHLMNVVVANNNAMSSSGIFLGASRDNLLENVTIVNNMSQHRYEYGGLTLGVAEGVGHSQATMRNCIITGNQPQDIRLFVWNEDQRVVNLNGDYNDLQGGRDRIRIDNGGDVQWGENNLDADPMFVDPENGDYHLTPDSPCIDAGDPDSPLDPDSTRADIGAFYFPQQNIFVEQEVLNFGHVEFGLQDSLELRIQNYGKLPLTITSQTITQDEPAFLNGIGGGEVVIEPGAIHSSWIIFIPTDLLQFEATLEIESDDRDEPIIQIVLQGEALLSINADDIIPPIQFGLSEAYPNPFNSSTTLTYSMQIPAQVSLSVYDMSGRCISTLVNAFQPTGNHTAVWNEIDAESGVYFVQMEAGGYKAARKVILMR